MVKINITMKKIICFLLNYKHDENAIRLFNILSPHYKTFIIDTFHKENGSKFPLENENVILCDNLYYGGSYIKAYEIAHRENADYLLQITTDVTIDDINTEKMIGALKIFDKIDNIGVYFPSLKNGSKAMGATNVIQQNCHLFNCGTNQLRNAYRNEGWFDVINIKVADQVFTNLSYDKNKYGWGINDYLCRKAILMGLRIVADDRYEIFHPPGIEYNSQNAYQELINFRKRYYELGIVFPEEYGKNIEEIKN